jgi:hypothetical protein
MTVEDYNGCTVALVLAAPAQLPEDDEIWVLKGRLTGDASNLSMVLGDPDTLDLEETSINSSNEHSQVNETDEAAHELQNLEDEFDADDVEDVEDVYDLPQKFIDRLQPVSAASKEVMYDADLSLMLTLQEIPIDWDLLELLSDLS